MSKILYIVVIGYRVTVAEVVMHPGYYSFEEKIDKN